MGNLVCCAIEPRVKSATPPVPAKQTPGVNGNNNHAEMHPIESAQNGGVTGQEEPGKNGKNCCHWF